MKKPRQDHLSSSGKHLAFSSDNEAGTQASVLFASGYSEGTVDINFLTEERLELIQKPYQKDDLLRKIRQMLDS